MASPAGVEKSRRADDAQTMAEEASRLYDYVRFTWADIHGVSRSKIATKNSFQKFFAGSMCVYEGASVLGLQGEVIIDNVPMHTALGNVTVLPQPGTLHWVRDGGPGRRVGQVLCEMVYDDRKTGISPQLFCTRYVARQQLEKLRTLGYEFFSGFEVELLFVNEKDNSPVFDSQGEVFVNSTFSKNEDMIFSMDAALRSQGVELEAVQSEYMPGQFELITRPELGLKTADNVFILKDSLRTLAGRNGCKAVFMPKPYGDTHTCSGFHFSFSLKTLEGGNAFSDPSDPNGLSSVCYNFLGGLLRHTKALTALCSPTVNCYRRMNRIWCPDHVEWGLDDRIATFRVKNTSPAATYIECRMPSSACNPYLVMAGVVAAGLAGLADGLSCPPPRVARPAGQAPPDVVPPTLSAALDALAADTVLIEALGPEVVAWFLALKRAEAALFPDSDPTTDNETEANLKKERDYYFNIV